MKNANASIPTLTGILKASCADAIEDIRREAIDFTPNAEQKKAILNMALGLCLMGNLFNRDWQQLTPDQRKKILTDTLGAIQ